MRHEILDSVFLGQLGIEILEGSWGSVVCIAPPFALEYGVHFSIKMDGDSKKSLPSSVWSKGPPSIAQTAPAASASGAAPYVAPPDAKHAASVAQNQTHTPQNQMLHAQRARPNVPSGV